MKCFQVVLNKLPPEIHLFAESLNTVHSLWKNLPGSKVIEVTFPLTGDLATWPRQPQEITLASAFWVTENKLLISGQYSSGSRVPENHLI